MGVGGPGGGGAQAAGAKGSQLAANAKAMDIKCGVCMQQFMCTSSEAKLKEHSENRHPKETFQRCFPTFGQ